MKKKKAQTIKKCEHCGNTLVQPYPSKTRRFCSRLCKNANQRKDESKLTHKTCGRCQKSLPVELFYWVPSNQKYYYLCKSCRRDYNAENLSHTMQRQSMRLAARRKNHWADYRYPFLKHSAKRRNIPFLISKEEFCAWYEAQSPHKCAYCELSLEQLRHMGIDMSVDRADNVQGYTLNNITLACLTCNKIKLDVLTYEDMRLIGQVVRNRLLANHNCNCAKGFYGECPHTIKGNCFA